MTAEAAAELTGLIYDAAFDEQLWVTVMNRMADAVGGGATAMIRKNLTTGQGSGAVRPHRGGAVLGLFRPLRADQSAGRGDRAAARRRVPDRLAGDPEAAVDAVGIL